MTTRTLSAALLAAALLAPALLAGSPAFAQDPAGPAGPAEPAEPAEPSPAEPAPAEPSPAEPAPAEPATEPAAPDGTGAVPAEPVPPAQPAPAEPAPADPAPADTLVEAPPPIPARTWRPVEPDHLLRFALSFEASTLANRDPMYDLFASGDAMGGVGLSAGVRLVPNLAVVAGWQRVRRGAEVTFDVDETDADFESDSQTLRAALLANELTLGLRADFGIAGILRPYAAGHAMAVTTRVRLDDDPTRRDNPGQVEAFGLSPGALLTFGAELRLPVSASVQPAVHLEMGPSWLLPADLDALGEMQPGGFALRTGVGLRF